MRDRLSTMTTESIWTISHAAGFVIRQCRIQFTKSVDEWMVSWDCSVSNLAIKVGDLVDLRLEGEHEKPSKESFECFHVDTALSQMKKAVVGAFAVAFGYHWSNIMILDFLIHINWRTSSYVFLQDCYMKSMTCVRI